MFFQAFTLKKYKGKLIEVERARISKKENGKKWEYVLEIFKNMVGRRCKEAMQSIKDTSELIKLLTFQQEESKFYDKQFRKEEHEDSLEENIYEKSIQS